VSSCAGKAHLQSTYNDRTRPILDDTGWSAQCVHAPADTLCWPCQQDCQACLHEGPQKESPFQSSLLLIMSVHMPPYPKMRTGYLLRLACAHRPPQPNQYTGNNLFLASYKDTGPSTHALGYGHDRGSSTSQPQFYRCVPKSSGESCRINSGVGICAGQRWAGWPTRSMVKGQPDLHPGDRGTTSVCVSPSDSIPVKSTGTDRAGSVVHENTWAHETNIF